MLKYFLVSLFFTTQFSYSGNEFLYLEDLDHEKGERYVIGIPPMNNTGDCYHMLSYMLLAQHHQKEIPEIVYGYDGAEDHETAESKLNTYSQVQRAQTFFTQLGYEKNIRVIKSKPLKLYRDSPRRKAFGPLLAQKQYTHLIDQKLLTTFLVNHFIEFGKQETADIIRGQLIKRLVEANQEELFFTKLEEQVSQDIKDITKKMREEADPEKPLLILHARYSAKSKTQQNIDEGVLVKLEDYLTKGVFRLVSI